MSMDSEFYDSLFNELVVLDAVDLDEGLVVENVEYL